MTEEETAIAEKKEADDLAKKEAFEKAQELLKGKSAEDLIKIVNDANQEAKKHRLKKNESEEERDKLIQERDKLVKEQKARDEKKLKADGKLQELIDFKETELGSQRVELDSLKVKADEFEVFKAAKVETAKAELAEKWLDEYAKLSLSALDSLVKSIAGSKDTPHGDDGASGGKVIITLTAEQKEEAHTQYSHLDKSKAEEYFAYNLIKYKKEK